MTVISMTTERKALPSLRKAKHHLKKARYMTAKRLASIMKIDSTVAGCCLVSLGWVKISNKTYERLPKKVDKILEATVQEKLE